MSKKMRQTVHDLLIVTAIFTGFAGYFWRIILYGYPSDFEVIITLIVMFCILIAMFIENTGGKNERND